MLATKVETGQVRNFLNGWMKILSFQEELTKVIIIIIISFMKTGKKKVLMYIFCGLVKRLGRMSIKQQQGTL